MGVSASFLSLVLVVDNRESELGELLSSLSAGLFGLVADHEIVVVDNASTDNSVGVLQRLTRVDGLPNLQVFCLSKQVDPDVAVSVGLEHALGDLVVVFDPDEDSIEPLADMLERAASGRDAVFGRNHHRARQRVVYSSVAWLFYKFFRRVSGVDLASDAPAYRLMSRQVVNFILQHPQPAVAYRHLPATGGFSRETVEYTHKPERRRSRKLSGSLDRGARLIVSTSTYPMRLAASLALMGAIANIVYSIYVLIIAVVKDNVAPGWVSMSLQQSGMFFLVSVVLFVMAEYVLTIATALNQGPAYFVAQEFTSGSILRQDRLNVEIAGVQEPAPARSPDVDERSR